MNSQAYWLIATKIDVIGEIVAHRSHGQRLVGAREAGRLRHADEVVALAALHLPAMRQQKGLVVLRQFDQGIGLEGIRHHATVVSIDVWQVERLAVEFGGYVFPELQRDIDLAEHHEAVLALLQQQRTVLVLRSVSPLHCIE